MVNLLPERFRRGGSESRIARDVERERKKNSRYRESGPYLDMRGDVFVERDVAALEVARRSIVTDAEWDKMPEDKKAAVYRKIANRLTYFEKYKDNADYRAMMVGLGSSGYQPTEAIAGANALERMRTLPDKKKRAYEGYFLKRDVRTAQPLPRVPPRPRPEPPRPRPEPIPQRNQSLVIIKYFDRNGNGARDPGEPGIGEVTFTIINTSTNETWTFATNEHGEIILSDIPVGTYRVIETVTQEYPVIINITSDFLVVREAMNQVLVRVLRNDTTVVEFGNAKKQFKTPGEIGGESRYGPGEPLGRGAWTSGRMEGRHVSAGEGDAAKAMMPAVRQAIMWGRKQLGIAARQRQDAYIRQHRDELRTMRNEYNNLRNAYRRGWRIMNRIVGRMERSSENFGAASARVGGGRVFGGRRRNAANDLLDAFGPLAATSNLRDVQQYMRDIQERMRDIEYNFRKKLAATDLYEELERFLKPQAGRFAHEAALRYNLMWRNEPYKTFDATPPGGPERSNEIIAFIQKDLEAEASKLSDFWTRAARSTLRRMGGSMALGMRALSMQSMRIGDWWHLITSNVFEFIKGPWILGSLLVIVQYLAITAWAGEYVPGILAAPYLIFAPIIAAVLLFVINYANSTYPMEWVEHLISGALMGLTLVLLFAGLGIDPLSSIWLFWGLFFGLFLIAAFSFYPQGRFSAIVPIAIIVLIFGYASLGPYSGQVREVRDQTVLPLKMVWTQLKGTGEYVWLLATNPTEWYARQQMQNVRSESPLDQPKGVEITDIQLSPPTVPANQDFFVYLVIENKGEQTAKSIKVSAGCENSEYCTLKEVPVDYQTELKSGQGDRLQYKFTALGRKSTGRSAEGVFAKPIVNVSYIYSTNSSLSVELATRSEIERRQLSSEGGKENRYFYPQVAYGIAQPAQLSLNVGPQPLEEGKTATMVAAVLNARTDGTVVLEPTTAISINLPEVVGSGLSCTSAGGVVSCSGGECRMIKEHRIGHSDFSSILPIYCTFTVGSLPDGRPSITSLITGELREYRYDISMEKSIKVTAPIGVIINDECTKEVEDNWDDYQKYQPVITANVKRADFSVSAPDGSTTAIPSLASLTGGEDNAKMLVAAVIWPTSATGGASGEIPSRIVQIAKQEGLDEEGQRIALKVAKAESSFRQCTDGSLSCDDSKIVKSGTNDYGAMQINKNAHPHCFTTISYDPASSDMCTGASYCSGKTVYDVDCNIQAGVRLLKSNREKCGSWEEALGRYNTGSCNANAPYVDRVRGQDVSAYESLISGSPSTGTAQIRQTLGFTDEQGGLMHVSIIDAAQTCGNDIYAADYSDLQDPEKNILCGVKVLAFKMSRNSGLWDSLKNDQSYLAWKSCLALKGMQVVSGGTGAIVVQKAREKIGGDYVWGGESDAEGGFDCSGLAHYAYGAAGSSALEPRTTADNYYDKFKSNGPGLDSTAWRAGDLCFFDWTQNGRIDHVGIFTEFKNGKPQMVDAKSTSAGILEEEININSGFEGCFRVVS